MSLTTSDINRILAALQPRFDEMNKKIETISKQFEVLEQSMREQFQQQQEILSGLTQEIVEELYGKDSLGDDVIILRKRMDRVEDRLALPPLTS